MTKRGGRVDKSGAGESPTSPVHLSTLKETVPGTEATAIGISALALVDQPNDPLTPTTIRTLEAATTETECSSDHGRDEVIPSPDHPRQMIAVSVSKLPSAFFNLARKFLITDEECDLSALEGAIVSAVDAAHLLERSKIATIVRIQTSYVSVEPKKRRDYGPTSNIGEKSQGSPQTETATTSATKEPPETIESSLPVAAELRYSELGQPVASTVDSSSSQTAGKTKSSSGTLRRARIVITVKRTEAYEKWLLDNSIHDIHAGHDDDHII